jgi:hypothetical protein
VKRLSLLPLVTAVTLAAPSAFAGAWTDCELHYALESWAVFYKETHGSGTVHCSNGQRADVRLRGRGGGLALGVSEIADGRGRFSRVRDISEVFGVSARAGAGAGAGNAAASLVSTKGDVSLAMSGTGRGVELGIAFGSLELARR